MQSIKDVITHEEVTTLLEEGGKMSRYPLGVPIVRFVSLLRGRLLTQINLYQGKHHHNNYFVLAFKNRGHYHLQCVVNSERRVYYRTTDLNDLKEAICHLEFKDVTGGDVVKPVRINLVGDYADKNAAAKENVA